MADINTTLHAFDYFHDWHIESIALRNQDDQTCADVLILGLRLDVRRVTVIFEGMSRLGVENGGIANIVLSMEKVQPNTQVEAYALSLLKRSLPGKRKGEHIVYLHPTAGFGIAVECESVSVQEL